MKRIILIIILALFIGCEKEHCWSCQPYWYNGEWTTPPETYMLEFPIGEPEIYCGATSSDIEKIKENDSGIRRRGVSTFHVKLICTRQ